jgi:hypothetical protein
LTKAVKHLIKQVKQGPSLPSGKEKKKRVKRTEMSNVNWFNRFHSLPSRNRKKKKVKEIETSRSSPFFCILPQQKPSDTPSFFIKKIHTPHRIYRGTKVYLIRSPCPCPPLVYYDRVIF